MATATHPNPEVTDRPSREALVDELYNLLEAHFDEIGLSEEERDRRYAAAAEDVTAENARLSKLATS